MGGMECCVDLAKSSVLFELDYYVSLDSAQTKRLVANYPVLGKVLSDS